MEYLLLGKIFKPHGLKGEVKVFSNTNFASLRYKKGNVVFILDNNEYKPLIVHSYYSYKNIDVVSFENYLDINKINDLLNKNIYIKKSDAILPDNYYHYSDLINLNIISEDKIIAKVVGVIEYPANVVLKCITNDKKDLIIPFVDEFIIKVDLKNKEIIVKLIEGMLWR